MSDAMLWPYGKCVECANKRDCVDSQAQIIACMSNGYPDYKPHTNADRIRAMTDEELAELFEMIPHSGNPPTYTIDGFCIDDGLRTKRQWLDWLRQETEEGE